MKFFDSFWNPDFYKNKEGWSFWRGFGRLVLLDFIVGVIVSVVFYGLFARNIPEYVTLFEAKLISGYPSGLTLTLKNGVLTKSIPGPLQVYPVEDFFPSDATKTKKDTPKYFIAIDDSQPVSLSAYQTSGALIFLAKDGFIMHDKNNGTRMSSYGSTTEAKDLPAFSLGTMTDLFSILNGYVKYAPVILCLVLLVAITIFAPLGQLLYLLFAGLVVMLLGKQLLGKKVEYGDAYVISMYALPTTLVFSKGLNYLFAFSGVVAGIPFLQTLLLLALLWLMFTRGGKKEESSSSTVLA
jgi:hypothetical protein